MNLTSNFSSGSTTTSASFTWIRLTIKIVDLFQLAYFRLHKITTSFILFFHVWIGIWIFFVTFDRVLFFVATISCFMINTICSYKWNNWNFDSKFCTINRDWYLWPLMFTSYLFWNRINLPFSQDIVGEENTESSPSNASISSTFGNFEPLWLDK